MTVEFWLKDMNSALSTTEIIFENTADGTDALIQIGIITNSTLSTNRTIYCVPQVASQSSAGKIVNVQTYNTWTHFACVSDGVSMTTRAVYYLPTNPAN